MTDLERARAEIERLGAYTPRDIIENALVAARNEALEEAIQAIDNISWDWPSPWIDDAESFKAAIRTLKGKT